MQTDSRRHRILIGEADPLRRAALQKVLEGLGYSVESCGDGQAALHLLQAADAPFAALLDFDLPGCSCPAVCQELARQNSKSFPWIVAMYDPNSGFASIQTPKSARILESGVCDLLARPIGELELYLCLKTAERVQSAKEELERTIEAVGFQASHDPLTGLWNREALLPLLFQETDRVRRTGASLSMMLIDLDHFTHRNLEFGYSVCDSVLQQLSVRLRRHLRSYDILGRSGEDEFLLALPGCGLEDALAMAERLRVGVMHSPFRARGVSLTVRASFGVAQSGGRSPLVVLREAERALTAAKEAGRDRVRYLTLQQPLMNDLQLATAQGYPMSLPTPPEAGKLAVFPFPSSAEKTDWGR